MKKERIHKYYNNIAVEDLLIIYHYKNIMELPQFDKIILSTTSKKFLLDKKNIIDTFGGCFLLSGQKGILREARKSVAGFKLRKGNIIGCVTTLRRKTMYTFLDRMITFGCQALLDITTFASDAKVVMSSKAFATGRLPLTEPIIENWKLSDSDTGSQRFEVRFLSHFKAFSPKGPFEFEACEALQAKLCFACKTKTQNLYRKKKLVIGPGKRQNVVFRKEKKYFNMGMKSFHVAKNFPEYEHFFSIFESIKGFNAVWSLSFSKATKATKNGFFSKSVPLLRKPSVTNCLHMYEPYNKYLFLPKQKKKIFFTQFQCPSVLIN